jgi:glycosyltransferase involved in cell wall biosynthesis
LGSEIIVERNHEFTVIKLLYVGALDNRNITETIKGIQVFLSKHEGNSIKLSYNIIGFGSDNEILKIEEIITEYDLSDSVRFEGRKTHEELVPYFEKANIGIVYIPQTQWYDCQPATKLFEYLLSGMPVIATSTSENRLIVDETNGVLINDTPEGFCKGLEEIYNRRNSFNSATIRKTVEAYTWENIVNTNLKPYLLRILE